MVRGLDQDESNFLDEVSRQQCLLEKQTRDEEMQELLEYRISFTCVRIRLKQGVTVAVSRRDEAGS